MNTRPRKIDVKVLISGAQGFIGRNLSVRIAERGDIEVVEFVRGHSTERLADLLEGTSFVFHLAGVNRPTSVDEFATGNADLTAELCKALARTGRPIPVLYASSIQAEQDNPYGISKRKAEEALRDLGEKTGAPVFIFRLTNVFGKWARPNYNSAVATFCHNIARDLPITINDPAAVVNLVYVDDVIERFLAIMDDPRHVDSFCFVEPEYRLTVGDLAARIRSYREGRETLMSEHVGVGLERALYATYVSYLPPERFAYPLRQHGDARGMFVEMLKTRDSGQFSFFTAHPGVTRGGHYHHSKTEKFLVIKGNARFRFRQIVSGEQCEVLASGENPQVVETVPGWSHDVTNVGTDEMIVMLWANEVFDRAHPDTIACPTSI